MKKRLAAILICLSAIAVLYGCESILEDETWTITARQEPTAVPTDSVIEANSFEELKEEALRFVKNHEDAGSIRVYNYDGDLQKDVDDVCRYITQDDPIGSFAVLETTGTVTKIVSYNEVEFRIFYKNVAKEQLDSITTISTIRFLKSELQDTLSAYEPSMTILTNNVTLISDDALQFVDEIYYENPIEIVMIPVTSVELYPDHGTNRLIDFTFGYRYETSTLKVMESRLKQTVQSIAEQVSGSNDGAILLSLAEHLMDTVEYDAATAESGEYSNQKMAATAYGALVTGSAVGEGYAMAYKALCDELGIECYVVLGERDGNPHAWNIVELEGNYYHIDVSMCDTDGIASSFLLNDKKMAQKATWDTSKYKTCDGPLTYDILMASGNT